MAESLAEQALEIFEEALQLEHHQREAFLDRRCGDRHHLRREVEALLEHEQGLPRGFMDVPTDGVGISSNAPSLHNQDGGEAEDFLIGKNVGQFRVLELISSGGVGAVYLARQQQPNREVALKVLRHGWAGASAIRRFQLESEVLAHLRHPNIAQVYAAGTHPMPPTGQPVPFFAMEYVPQGRRITEHADALELGLRNRLELILQVCDAVQHAHQKGVIHRDLKPGNILVGAEGRVKVIDFGVARVSGSDLAATTIHTGTGQIIGTLQYMSPEQCAADTTQIDTRCDVYALGVVLYELITGRVPYDISNTTLQTAMRIVCEHMPDPPSRFNKRLRGNLDAIISKAIRKDPTKRYPSVAALAQDIRWHLAGQPVEAKPLNRWNRLARWVLGHPIASTTILCLSVALTIAGGTMLAMELANRRPYRVEWANMGGEARLVSFSGQILRTWQVSHSGHPFDRWSELITSPGETTDRFLPIGFYFRSPDRRNAGSICVYDIDRDYNEPIWCDRLTIDDLPPHLLRRKYFGSPHAVNWGCFDIFEEIPGPEVVAVHVPGDWSPRCIRIYALLADKAQVLYEVWHDGSAGDMYYMSRAGLLVFSGDNAEVGWKQRQGGDFVEGPTPRVLFAIRPKLGFKSKQFLRSTPGGDSPLDPVWYKCLLPPGPGTDVASFGQMRHPSDFALADRRVLVSVNLRAENELVGGFMFEVDESGKEVPGTRFADGMYQNLKDPPDYRMFHLGDLPPIINTSGAAEAWESNDPTPLIP